MVYDPGPLLLEARFNKHHDKGGKFASGDGGGTGDWAGADALPRFAKHPTVSQAAKGANPNFGTTTENPTYRDAARAGKPWTPDMGPPPSGAYEENCTNCVHSVEMRMRGYDVQAAPLNVLDKYGYASGRTEREMDEQLSSSWRLPGGAPHGRTFGSQQWRTFGDIDAEVKGWPDGGRGYVTVGKHVFNVVKNGKKVDYIEGQFDESASRVVTSAYKRRFGGRRGAEKTAKLIRLDDLVPAAGILDSVTVA